MNLRRIQRGKERAGKGGDREPSRRQLLAGALGVFAAETLAKAAPARAANGSPIVMGQGNVSSSNTSINDQGGDTAFAAQAQAGGTALEGDAANGIGVVGTSASGDGVHGNGGGSGTGVVGTGGSNGTGLFGQGQGSGRGVIGQGGSNGAAGVHGFGGPGAGTGVGGFGTGNGDGVQGTGGGSGNGVTGTGGGAGGNGLVGVGGGSSGNGVKGTGAGSGNGVYGAGGAPGATGVFGQGGLNGNGVVGTGQGSGAGVFAQNPGSGPALQVAGPALFSRSGVVVVPAGQISAKVTGVPLTGSSLVLATIQQDVPFVFVRAAVPDPNSSSFTIYLGVQTSNPPRVNVPVGWYVVN